MAAASKTRYIPALDGLRALAVLSVIAYHLGFGWASGGLLGVTIFFVLSGYLITSLLLAEWTRSKTIDLKAFWLRRAKRLLPAIIFLLVCVAVLCALFNHDLLTKMRPDTPPALFFYSNWWYIFRDLSYFETLGAPSPLTHFWSLAIEEQFYLIWPVLLFILFKLGAKRKVITRIVLGMTLVSVLLMVLLYNPNLDPSRVYYGTDTRAFSLLIGALLAFVWPSNQLSHASDLKLSRSASIAFNGIGIAAFAGLVFMLAIVDGFTPFMYRGGILLASILTAIIITVLVHPKSLLGKVAALAPLVWLGKRSYGIYLWHYPIILLMTPQNFTGEPSVWYILLQLLLMLLVSAFSYRFIEDPIRKGAIGKFVDGLRQGSTTLSLFLQRHLIPAVGGSLLVLAATICFLVIPPTEAVANIDALRQEASEAPTVPETTSEEVLEAPKPFDILLIGDSVSVRTIPHFQAMFPLGGIDSAVNRPIWDGSSVYNYYKDSGLVGNTIVFSLGTNNSVVDEQIDEVMTAIGSEKAVYFINTRSPRPWVSTTNDTLSRAAERYPNVKVIDWFGLSANHDDYFDGDGTHLNEQGAQVYVEMIRQATGFPEPTPSEEIASEEPPPPVENTV